MPHAPRFADMSVAQVWATLLDEDIYRASVATMYHHLLWAAGESRERRARAV